MVVQFYAKNIQTRIQELAKEYFNEDLKNMSIVLTLFSKSIAIDIK